MAFYEKNLDIIKRYRSEIYDEIINYQQVNSINSFDIKINSVETLDNINTIIIEKDKYIYRLNSIYRPIKEAITWSDSLDLKDILKVISIYGFGNGLYVSKLLEKLEDREFVIVYEPSFDIFMHVIRYYDISNLLLDEKLFIIIDGINDSELKNKLQAVVTWDNVYSQRRYCLPQYNRMFPEIYDKFLKILKYNNDRVVMVRNTEAHFGKVVVENTFSNLKYLENCNIFHDYIDLFPNNMTAIIVSAGPSLNKNIQYLRKAQQKSVIFAVDRSLQFLYQNDIIPDFAVTVDPLKKEDCFAEGYDVNIPLFAELHSNKKILDIHKGKKIFYNAFGYINYFLNNFNKNILCNMSIGTSVATAAFSLCIRLNFKRVILVGQDLAYASDGITTHAGEVINKDVSYNELYVEGNDEVEVKTRNDWYDFLKWFEYMISLYPDVKVVNATEGGAKIQGTEIMKLSDAIEKYCTETLDCSKLNESLKPTYNLKELEKLKEYIRESGKDLPDIKLNAKKAVELCDDSIELCKRKQENYMQHFKELNDINAFMNSCPTYKLIDSYITEATSEVMGDINTVKSDKFEDSLFTFENSKVIYEEIIQAVDEMDKLIERYIY